LNAQSGNSKMAGLNAAVSRGFSRPASPPPQSASGVASADGDPFMSEPYVLPSPHESHRLIDVYFENTGRFWPCLYKPRVLKNLGNMRNTGFKNVERSHLCVLNLMFAFASTHCPSPLPATVKLQQGDVFLQRALALMDHIRPAAENLESSEPMLDY
jgi:hypothetical protein